MSFGGIGVITVLSLVTLTMTVSFNDNAINPGFNIEVEGLLGYDKYKIVLIDPEGVYPNQTVRGTDMATVIGDNIIVSDYEFPNFRSQKYRLELYIAGVLTDSTEVTINDLPRTYFGSVGSWPNANAWLRSVNQPELTRPCYVDEYDTYTRPGRVLSKDFVLGRKLAVESTDVLGGREGTFTFNCGVDFQTWEGQAGIPSSDYEFLFDRGDTLMLNVFDDDNLDCRPLYLRVSGITRKRIGRDGHTYYDRDTGEWVVNTYPVFNYQVEFVEVDRPPVGTARTSEFSWQDVLDSNTTWQTNFDDHTDWLDVLANPTV